MTYAQFFFQSGNTKFKGRVMPNEDEFQKYVRTEFR